MDVVDLRSMKWTVLRVARLLAVPPPAAESEQRGDEHHQRSEHEHRSDVQVEHVASIAQEGTSK